MIQWLAGGFLLFTWLLVGSNYGSLPATVPTHFNGQGHPDGFGPKASLWFLPVLATLLYAMMTFLKNKAHLLPRKAGADSTEAGIAPVRALFSQLRLSISVVFCLVVWLILASVRSGMLPEAGVFLPFMTLLMLAPTVLFIFRVGRRKRQ